MEVGQIIETTSGEQLKVSAVFPKGVRASMKRINGSKPRFIQNHLIEKVIYLPNDRYSYDFLQQWN